MAYYVFLAVWFAVNPARMLSSTFVADFFTIGLLCACHLLSLRCHSSPAYRCGVCLIAVPVVVLFFIRSFDKPAGQPPATTLTPTEAAAGRSKHLTPRATVVSFRRSAGEQVRTPLEIHVDIEAATRVDVDTGEEIKEKM